MEPVAPNFKTEMIKSNDIPVVSFVNQLLSNAIKKHVSDIHIEPLETDCRIRWRIDGILHEAVRIPLQLAAQMNMRLKIMSHLNIAEKRLPQDGRFKIIFDKKIDIRINTCPTLFGEKIALRLLYTKDNAIPITSLGMTTAQQQLFLEKLAKPQGLILVTGPTGSGKTTTLYAALHHLNQIQYHIVTIEDPIEIELSGINQININPRIGLHFKTLLPTVLRQDPDIIMIGEIRDQETAAMAMDAAETGHLVLSTLHTRNARETLMRLNSLGIEKDHLINASPLIVSQRLIRILCPHCSGESTKQKDCAYCHNGHMGRTGIFELFSMHGAEATAWMTLQEAALEKINLGITSCEEIKRVLGEY